MKNCFRVGKMIASREVGISFFHFSLLHKLGYTENKPKKKKKKMKHGKTDSSRPF